MFQSQFQTLRSLNDVLKLLELRFTDEKVAQNYRRGGFKHSSPHETSPPFNERSLSNLSPMFLPGAARVES